MKTLNYDTSEFSFAKYVQTALEVEDLANIHRASDFSYNTKFERSNDQSTHYHKLFYNLARTSEFQELYKNFLGSVIKPRYTGKIVYQKVPTFRLQFPNNIAVGEFHKDRDYRNGEWASKVKELNYFLPLTRATNTNSIWVESAENLADYAPMEVEYGQVVEWDGCNLRHGNKENIEGFTRISMDFRVIDKNNYIPSNHSSINTQTVFAIGGYYDEM